MESKSMLIAIILCFILSSMNAAVYIQNFDSAGDGATSLGDGSTLQDDKGELQVVENSFPGNTYTALRLVQDGTPDGSPVGNTGEYILPDLDPGDAIESFDLTFTSLMKDADDDPADGFSFNFGDLDLLNPGSNVEDGWNSAGGDVLTVSWDTFDNTPFTGPDISGRVAAFVNGTEVAGMDNTANNIIEGSLNAAFQDVSVSWSESNGLSISYAGTVVYANDAVSFTAQSGYRFAFGARTGGFDQDVFIDDVELTTAVPESSHFAILTAFAAVGFVLLRRNRR